MRTTGTARAFGVARFSAVVQASFVLPLAFVCFAFPAHAARGPQPVSPGSTESAEPTEQRDAVEARCPTFLWSGVPGARGYELAVFRISPKGSEPELVTRATVSGDARGWTPSGDRCLERGQRYAWSVASATARPASAAAEPLAWSPAMLFEVEAAPSLEEVEQAITVLERHRAQRLGSPDTAVAASADGVSGAGRTAGDRASATALPRRPGVTRIAGAATPLLGVPSLRVSANVALDADSNLFKDADVFLWDDTDGNTALGRNALRSTTQPTVHNTAVGRDALRYSARGEPYTSPSEGSYNTAVGDRALRQNSIGRHNTATGAYALRYNTTGSFNTASGSAALHSNTTGSFNTASGSAALRSNTSGSENTASGFRALYFNTTGFRNTASGARALDANTTGSYNTASGFRALGSNTTGSRNTASGFQALLSNTTGTFNTASGYNALQSNTTGAFNTAIGHRALQDNTTAPWNTASGHAALRFNTTGSRNVANGSYALFSNATGSYNTASGYRALFSNTTGSRNTALGHGAGHANTTNSDSIFIANEGAAADSATIKIGTQGTQTTAFIAGIRGATTAPADAVAVLISSTGQLGTINSSRALKRDIQDLGALSERLLELRPVAFRYKQHAVQDPDTPLQFGLIAEEVAEVFPELVVFDQEGNPETVKYHLLSSLLLGELQRQDERVAEQQRELRKHEERVAELTERLEALEARAPGEAKRRRDVDPDRGRR